MQIFFKKFLKNKKGQSALELALCLPFILYFLFVIPDIGYVFLTQQDLNTIAREASRKAAATNSVEGVAWANKLTQQQGAFWGKTTKYKGTTCSPANPKPRQAVTCTATAEIPMLTELFTNSPNRIKNIKASLTYMKQNR